MEQRLLRKRGFLGQSVARRGPAAALGSGESGTRAGTQRVGRCAQRAADCPDPGHEAARGLGVQGSPVLENAGGSAPDSGRGRIPRARTEAREPLCVCVCAAPAGQPLLEASWSQTPGARRGARTPRAPFSSSAWLLRPSRILAPEKLSFGPEAFVRD